jgi:uncharacterized cupin superfamily protein
MKALVRFDTAARVTGHWTLTTTAEGGQGGQEGCGLDDDDPRKIFSQTPGRLRWRAGTVEFCEFVFGGAPMKWL